MTGEAIAHAIAAGAHAEAAELIEASWVSYANACRHDTVLAWIGQLPEDMQSSNAGLLLVKAWMLSLSGKREEAGQVIAAAERLGEPGGGRSAGRLQFGRGEPDDAAGLLPVGWRADVGASPGGRWKMARRAAELEDPGSPWRPVACWAVGMGLYFREGEARRGRPLVRRIGGAGTDERTMAGWRVGRSPTVRSSQASWAASKNSGRGEIDHQVLSGSGDPDRAAGYVRAVPAGGRRLRGRAADAAGAQGAPTPDQRSVRAGHRPGAVRVAQHRSQPHPVDLPQARRLLTGPRPPADPRAQAPVAAMPGCPRAHGGGDLAGAGPSLTAARRLNPGCPGFLGALHLGGTGRQVVTGHLPECERPCHGQRPDTRQTVPAGPPRRAG